MRGSEIADCLRSCKCLSRRGLLSSQCVSRVGLGKLLGLGLGELRGLLLRGGIGLRDLVCLGVAKFKWPERLEWVSELPRSNVGKINKRLMRDRAAELVDSELRSGPRVKL